MVENEGLSKNKKTRQHKYVQNDKKSMYMQPCDQLSVLYNGQGYTIEEPPASAPLFSDQPVTM